MIKKHRPFLCIIILICFIFSSVTTVRADSDPADSGSIANESTAGDDLNSKSENSESSAISSVEMPSVSDSSENSEDLSQTNESSSQTPTDNESNSEVPFSDNDSSSEIEGDFDPESGSEEISDEFSLSDSSSTADNSASSNYTPTTTEIPVETSQTSSTKAKMLSGDNRYETASFIAREAYPNGCQLVFVVKGTDFPDALAVSGLAGAMNCPILLARIDSVPSATKELLEEWNHPDVIIIGDGFTSQCKNELGNVITEIKGDDRYKTSEAICQYGLDNGYFDYDEVIIASAVVPADALSMSSWSYHYHIPLLLSTREGSLKDSTKHYAGLFHTAYMAGAEVRVRESDVRDAGVENPIRLAGGDRYATSAIIADYFLNSYPQRTENADRTCYANGQDAHFPDALVGGMLAGQTGAPMILVSSDASDQTYSFSAKTIRPSDPDTIYLLGAVKLDNSQYLIKNSLGIRYILITEYADKTGSQGMFYTIKISSGGFIVIDGGNPRNESYVRQILSENGNHVDLWILTHPHPDHVGAFNRIYKNPNSISISNIYTIDMDYDSYKASAKSWDGFSEFELFRQQTQGDSRLHYVHTGDQILLNGLTFKVFNAYDISVTNKLSTDLPNDGSMMFKVTNQNESMLFCADVGTKMSDEIISHYGQELASDYIQMGHHGNGGLSEAFYRKVNPKVALFDAPEWLMNPGSSSKYTTPQNAALMKSLGAEVYYYATTPNVIELG